MKNRKVLVLTGGLLATLLMFIGCGEHGGEKEYGKAMSAWKAGELVKAQSLMEKAIRKTSGNEKKSLAWNQLGLILWQLDKTAEAADAFNESCVLSESVTGANLNLGIALFHAGRLDEAELALNNVLGENPKNQTALAMLGMIALKKKDWPGAAKPIAQTVRENPKDPAAQNALALAELPLSSGTAIQRLKQVVSAYPDYAPAAYNLATIYEKQLNSPSEALDWYKQYLRKAGADGSHVAAANEGIKRLSSTPAQPITKIDPATARRHMEEGAKLLTAKRYNEAISQFEKAIASDPNQKFSHYNLGYAYFNLGKYTEAATYYINALKLDPSYADARYMLSYSYFKLRKWSDAEREAEELAKVDKTRGEQMLTYIASERKR
jgi:tetratricopeptide (TPR) repeat protein